MTYFFCTLKSAWRIGSLRGLIFFPIFAIWIQQNFVKRDTSTTPTENNAIHSHIKKRACRHEKLPPNIHDVTLIGGETQWCVAPPALFFCANSCMLTEHFFLGSKRVDFPILKMQFNSALKLFLPLFSLRIAQITSKTLNQHKSLFRRTSRPCCFCPIQLLLIEFARNVCLILCVCNYILMCEYFTGRKPMVFSVVWHIVTPSCHSLR